MMKKARLPRPAEKVSVWHRLTASSFKEEDPSSFEEEDQEEEALMRRGSPRPPQMPDGDGSTSHPSTKVLLPGATDVNPITPPR